MLVPLLGLLAGCGAEAVEPPNDFAPDTVNEPHGKYAIRPDPGTWNCIAWPIRVSNESDESELRWDTRDIAKHGYMPTPLPRGYQPVGAVTMRTGAGVVACTPPVTETAPSP